MLDLSPEKLYQRYCNEEIDKLTLVNSLLLLIEESTDEVCRTKSITQLRRLGVKSDYLFSIMENLMISDINDKVRNAAASYISYLYFEKSYNIVNWAIKYEESYDCILTLINTLKKMHSEESKKLIISEIQKILKPRKDSTEKPYIFYKYRKRLKQVFKRRDIEDFTIHELAEILINYKTVSFLALTYPNFFFELDISTGLVSEIELADYLQFEVKGTPFGWKNNIESLARIKGLKNLRFIKKLDLSNNLIEDLSQLIIFKNLEDVNLANNKISASKNVEYLNLLPNLRYLDLRGNDITKTISYKDFKSGMRVVLKRFDDQFEL